MTATPLPSPLPFPRPAPDVLDDDLLILLQGMPSGLAAPRAPVLRERVLDRVARSARASRRFVTVRRSDAPAEPVAAGVALRTLYEAGRGPRRAGEPARVQLIELGAGTAWAGPSGHGWPADGLLREWLLMRGQARLGSVDLAERDYHRAAAGTSCGALASATGALLYLREASPAAGERPDAPFTLRDAECGWDDFAPGIKRRVLWQSQGEAAMLYHALPGAAVPRHGHQRDEECLMLDGELFLDEVLLRSGDYQLAPASTAHGGVFTDTGVVLFAHGDLQLDVLPG